MRSLDSYHLVQGHMQQLYPRISKTVISDEHIQLDLNRKNDATVMLCI